MSAGNLRRSQCKGCGRPIVWGVTVDGKRIPLDPSAPTYRVCRADGDGTVEVERTEAVFVSHFATCSQADMFSGSHRKGGN